MNSEQEYHSDSIYQALIASLRGNKDDLPPQSTGQISHPYPTDEAMDVGMEMDELDPLDLEEFNLAPSTSDFEAVYDRQRLNLAELPMVESRFQSLVKRRLQAEIELCPPLFPWETEISDYESEISESLVNSWVPPVSLWATGLSQFRLPVSIPETVLTQLLDACTEVVQSSLQQGAKMVQAVKTLFPEEPQLLNQLAGLVLLYPSRSPSEQQLFSKSYEEATTTQQMALLLLASREILNTLTLRVSPNQQSVERQWQTAMGNLTLKARYQTQGQASRLLIEGDLPQAGSLKLNAQPLCSAERSDAGNISIECLNLRPNQTYPLEVRLTGVDEKPLIFTIAVNS